MLHLEGKPHDLGGGMIVRRVLPQVLKRMLGPFVFFDHMGPLTASAEQKTDVRPHPHIGLSTLTYLFKGRIVHHDSLGSKAEIEPGGVNWMIAGNGISHSERAHEDDKHAPRDMHGLQLWIALPDELEDCDPSFQHYGRDSIPRDKNDQREIAVIAGTAFGLTSAVSVTSPLVMAEIKTFQSTTIPFDFPKEFEIGIYMMSGRAKVTDQDVGPLQMLILERCNSGVLEVTADAHFVILGGKPFTTGRHIWWNLVSSSLDKIEAAKKKWRDGTFPMVPGETEFIPLPEK